MAVPVALYALLVLPFVFHGVVGEPDLERTALAFVYGASSGLHETAGFHYGYTVSFGYYQGLYHLLTQSALLSPATVIAAINVVGFVSAVAAMLFLALYMARLFGSLAALAVCAVFGFSPVFLDLGTSGHPQVPALTLLLAGAWMLTFVTEEERTLASRISLGLAAFVIFTAALTVRADEAMAFPFLTLVGPPTLAGDRSLWLKGAARRMGVLLAACAAFAVLSAMSYHDSNAVSEGGGFVANFFATFYKPQTVPRGLLVFVLCTGVASIVTAAALSLTRAARLDRVTWWAIGLLAVPTLLFWLPNSTPGRHMLFAYLAVAILIAVLLVRTVRPAQVIAIAVLLPIANQVVAEATHGVLDRHYQWMYPLTVSRRATQSVPMGAFPWDHEAKQQAFTQLADEGRAFARACTGHVLVMSEDPHFMMMSMLELDRSVRLTSLREADTRVIRASGTRCTADFVEKQAPSRRDTLKDFLQVSSYDNWPIYFQELRRNPYDRTPVPSGRRFALEAAGPGRVAGLAPDSLTR
ncbi:MAG TPA: hypothetical protein VGM84_16145 [Steroidobacteraceae bacterium]